MLIEEGEILPCLRIEWDRYLKVSIAFAHPHTRPPYPSFQIQEPQHSYSPLFYSSPNTLPCMIAQPTQTDTDTNTFNMAQTIESINDYSFSRQLLNNQPDRLQDKINLHVNFILLHYVRTSKLTTESIELLPRPNPKSYPG